MGQGGASQFHVSMWGPDTRLCSEGRAHYINAGMHLEKEMAPHSSILAWRIPWTEETGSLQSIGLQRVGHNSVTKQRDAFVLTNSLTCSALTRVPPLAPQASASAEHAPSSHPGLYGSRVGAGG